MPLVFVVVLYSIVYTCHSDHPNRSLLSGTSKYISFPICVVHCKVPLIDADGYPDHLVFTYITGPRPWVSDAGSWRKFNLKLVAVGFQGWPRTPQNPQNAGPKERYLDKYMYVTTSADHVYTWSTMVRGQIPIQL